MINPFKFKVNDISLLEEEQKLENETDRLSGNGTIFSAPIWNDLDSWKFMFISPNFLPFYFFFLYGSNFRKWKALSIHVKLKKKKKTSPKHFHCLHVLFN